jgi:hypothetical protein
MDTGRDLISDRLPFGRLWCGEPHALGNTIGYATHYSRSHGAVIRVYDAAGNVIEIHDHEGDFKEPRCCALLWTYQWVADSIAFDSS